MPVVKGVMERVHLPLYDSLTVEPEQQLRAVENSSTLKFFVNVQGKTKLETNLQSASLLPHYNTFEARAMRVVISDLPPEFPDEPKTSDEDRPVTGQDPADNVEKQLRLDSSGTVNFSTGTLITADLGLGLSQIIRLLQEARENPEKEVELPLDDDAVALKAGPNNPLTDTQVDQAATLGDPFVLSVPELEGFIEEIEERRQPPKEQLRPNDGAGTLIGKLIYNTVTTFYVGEKIMIQMPTWFFPAGAGPYSEVGRFTTHGEPSPTATFRFAEPIFIDRQQNFRVEIEIPETDVLREIQKIYGPFFIWVVLDGYMTRDVQ
jgi:hypothetical protein